jgi:hypothetical protein
MTTRKYKMRKYKVYVEFHYIVEIEAKSKAEAMQKIHDINVADQGSLLEVEAVAADRIR